MTGSISSPGVGSGLDVKAIVDKLVSIEHRPVDVLAAQTKSVQTRLSSFGLLKSFMSNLRDAAAKLADASLWKTTLATSTNPAIATASPLPGSATPPTVGSYRLKVGNLAQAQTLVSAPSADPKAALGAGRLKIELGTWNDAGTDFQPKADALPATITLTDAASSLEDIRARINASNAGVDATLLRDASGTRLVVKSRATGQENAVRITASGPTDGDPTPAGLAALSYDPQHAAPGDPSLTRAQPARNAHATINGVDISSATNTLDGAVEGMRIALLKASDDAVDIGVAPDTGAMKKALNAFVGAYNDIAGYIATQTRYDATSKTAAALQGDATTLQLQKQLAGALSGTSAASSTFPRLLDVGIHLNADNTLSLDSSKADRALANPQELAKAFTAHDASDTSKDGFGVRFVALAGKTLDFEGLIATRTRALEGTIKRAKERQEKMEDAVSQYQARMLKVYTALDTKMSTLKAQNDYVTQQMKMLANNSK